MYIYITLFVILWILCEFFSLKFYVHEWEDENHPKNIFEFVVSIISCRLEKGELIVYVLAFLQFFWEWIVAYVNYIFVVVVEFFFDKVPMQIKKR